ncbi:hypothetical protein AB0395_21885 [Streptosporangium sp. NPDC051023]|uniref:hypothetical protein n=1 Tax=Streptosporangium sp. NPDC051023 TaxID=3155410 RepID=UPI00344B656B
MELTAQGARIFVRAGGEERGSIWWDAAAEHYVAEDTAGNRLGEHPLRTAALDIVAG